MKKFKITLTQIPLLTLVLFIGAISFSCSSDVDMKKQQKAFYVDADNNLLNKKGEIVKKAGEYKMEGGYYVDNKGQYIQRNIDKTKEKINANAKKAKGKMKNAASKSKDAMSNAASKTKDAMSNAASKTKDAMSSAASKTASAMTLAANRTTESVKANFNEMFNTKAVGTIYPLSEIKFDPKSHRIVNFKKEDVQGMAAALKENPGSRIQVQVYTADAKSRGENKKISNSRAELVKDMLVTLGVKEEQISFKGMGLPTEDAVKAVNNAVEVVVEK